MDIMSDGENKMRSSFFKAHSAQKMMNHTIFSRRNELKTTLEKEGSLNFDNSDVESTDPISKVLHNELSSTGLKF